MRHFIVDDDEIRLRQGIGGKRESKTRWAKRKSGFRKGNRIIRESEGDVPAPLKVGGKDQFFCAPQPWLDPEGPPGLSLVEAELEEPQRKTGGDIPYLHHMVVEFFHCYTRSDIISLRIEDLEMLYNFLCRKVEIGRAGSF
ncbi:MAG: hypothetical protein ACUVTO_06965 [Candidatus Caldatribacteriaceae bacterium]